ncbi:MAG: flagellar hook-basal body complex protein FliE [Aliarcobacter sp.]|nr:flagellar hook-basal body complex protein FliE [Aliarcobacter sp.]
MDISSISNSIGSLSLNTNNKIAQTDDKSFQNMLNNAISDVNNQQVKGYDSMQGIATGKVTNLQEAVQRIEEADLSMRLALEVKNKALNAYKEIMRIQV